MSTHPEPILVLGAGELGSAIINALLHHPNYDASTTPITLLLRKSTVSSPTQAKARQIEDYREVGVEVIGADIDNDNLETLTSLFKPYSTVIHAAGMTSPPGTQLKITRAVLAASVKLYFPWQHGVDYDVITRKGGQGMFSEQLDVRDLLRGQQRTGWIILSSGIFMSFLFEDFWGVIGLPQSAGTGWKVTALNSWDDRVTVTTASDIGRCTAELLFADTQTRNHPVYIAGDTLTYGQLADVIEQTMGKPVIREVWPLQYLKAESSKDPEDKLKQYRVVFAEGKGLAWDKDSTWSSQRQMAMQDVASWLAEHYPHHI